MNSVAASFARALSGLDANTQYNSAVIKSVVDEICKTLLASDVSVSVVKSFRASLLKKLEHFVERPLERTASLRSRIVNAIANELTAIVSCGTFAPQLRGDEPQLFLFVGLQGAGKTTSLSKIAHFLRSKGATVGVVCADNYRAGAYDQLKANLKGTDITFCGSKERIDAVSIVLDGLEQLRKRKVNVVLIDTSGRHSQSEELFAELKSVHACCRPQHVIYVVDSHIGQACYSQTLEFSKVVPISAIVLTKMDGNPKGGAALTSAAVAKCPIWFYCDGEGMGDLKVWKPKRYVANLLAQHGGANVLTTFAELTDNLDLEDGPAKMDFNLIRQMLSRIADLGVGNLVGKLLGGAGGAPPLGADSSELNATTKQLRRLIHIIDAMTPEERAAAQPFSDAQVARLARGAGTTEAQVRVLAKMLTALQSSTKQLRRGKKLRGRAAAEVAAARNGADAQQMLGALMPNLGSLSQLLG